MDIPNDYKKLLEAGTIRSVPDSTAAENVAWAELWHYLDSVWGEGARLPGTGPKADDIRKAVLKALDAQMGSVEAAEGEIRVRPRQLVGKTLVGQAPKLAPLKEEPESIPMRINCPVCGELHIDEGEFETRVHHTHACQKCGLPFRPALVPTKGVRFLPGFKNGDDG